MGTCGASLANAEDFRVQSKVFVGDATTPASETTTLFHNGMVYDFLAEPEEVSIFDPARGRFVLIDKARSVRTEISTEKISAFIEAMRKRASEHDEEFVRFLAKPELTQTIDKATSVRTFGSPWLTYELTNEPARSADVANQYSEFSDWYARLNAMTSPRALPPFARVQVNAALRQRQEIPKEVRLTVSPKQPSKRGQYAVRSEHAVQWRLSTVDRRRIEEINGALTDYQAVEFEAYIKPVLEQAKK